MLILEQGRGAVRMWTGIMMRYGTLDMQGIQGVNEDCDRNTELMVGKRFTIIMAETV